MVGIIIIKESTFVSYRITFKFIAGVWISGSRNSFHSRFKRRDGRMDWNVIKIGVGVVVVVVVVVVVFGIVSREQGTWSMW